MRAPEKPRRRSSRSAAFSEHHEAERNELVSIRSAWPPPLKRRATAERHPRRPRQSFLRNIAKVVVFRTEKANGFGELLSGSFIVTKQPEEITQLFWTILKKAGIEFRELHRLAGCWRHELALPMICGRHEWCRRASRDMVPVYKVTGARGDPAVGDGLAPLEIDHVRRRQARGDPALGRCRSARGPALVRSTKRKEKVFRHDVVEAYRDQV